MGNSLKILGLCFILLVAADARAGGERATEEGAVEAVPISFHRVERTENLQHAQSNSSSSWAISGIADKVSATLRKSVAIGDVEIVGNYRLSNKRVFDLIGNAIPKDLFKVSPGDLALLPGSEADGPITKALKQSPWCESSKISLSLFPHKLTITIREAEPWLVAELRGASWLVSRTGNLLEPLSALSDPELVLEASQLPRLSGLSSGSSHSGWTEEADNFSRAAHLVSLIELGGGAPFNVESFVYHSDGALELQADVGSGLPRVLFEAVSLEESEEKLRGLRAVLNDTKRRGELPSELDLRFSKRIISRSL